MGGRPAIKWGQVSRYFLRRDYEIRPSGGDKFIIAPNDGTERRRPSVRIGHKCCSQPGDELYGCYVSQLRNVFGVKPEDIAND